MIRAVVLGHALYTQPFRKLILIRKRTSIPWMRIDVIFDTICPWCYLGKKRLERALEKKPHLSVEVTWHAFLLNPNIPPEGMERRDYINAKFGNESRSNRIYESISEAGKPFGINFKFDQIRRTPNTVNAHRFVRFAQAAGQNRASQAVETLFHAYFVRGLDTGNSDVLCKLADEVGLDVESFSSYLASNENVEDIREQNFRAHRLNISGVPAFIIEGQFSISGAQEPQVIERLLEVAEERHRELFHQPLQPV